jgi:hypothetical protein
MNSEETASPILKATTMSSSETESSCEFVERTDDDETLVQMDSVPATPISMFDVGNMDSEQTASPTMMTTTISEPEASGLFLERNNDDDFFVQKDSVPTTPISLFDVGNMNGFETASPTTTMSPSSETHTLRTNHDDGTIFHKCCYWHEAYEECV